MDLDKYPTAQITYATKVHVYPQGKTNNFQHSMSTISVVVNDEPTVSSGYIHAGNVVVKMGSEIVQYTVRFKIMVIC